MINIVKMDIYRLFKTKAFYIIGVVFVGFVILLTYFSYELGDAEGIGTNLKIYVDYTMSFTIMVYTVVIAVFSVLFTTAESSSGYIKNIGGQISARSILILSKAVALLVYNIIMFVIYFIVQIIVNKIFFGYIEFSGEPKEFAEYVAIQILLHFALALLCMMVAVVIRKNGIAMTIAVILGLRITGNFYEGINMLFDNFEAFDISKYLLIGNMNSLLYAEDISSVASGAIIVGICFAAVSLLVSCLFFEKRDIV